MIESVPAEDEPLPEDGALGDRGLVLALAVRGGGPGVRLKVLGAAGPDTQARAERWRAAAAAAVAAGRAALQAVLSSDRQAESTAAGGDRPT